MYVYVDDNLIRKLVFILRAATRGLELSQQFWMVLEAKDNAPIAVLVCSVGLHIALLFKKVLKKYKQSFNQHNI